MGESNTRDDGGPVGPRVSSTTRRQFIRAGAATGAAVWALPVIDSLTTPAAAASCTCSGAGGVNWSSTTGNAAFRPASLNGPANIGGYPWVVGTFNGVTVTFSYSSTNRTSPYDLVFPGSSQLTGRQPTTQNGNVTGIYGIDKNNVPSAANNPPSLTAPQVTLRIDFSCDIKNLDMTILDIDSASAATVPSTSARYRDEVTVSAVRGASPVAGTYTPVAGASATFLPNTVQSGNGPFTFTAIDGSATGATSTTGNLRVQVVGPLSHLILTYTSRQTTNPGTLQEVALANLAWTCT